MKAFEDYTVKRLDVPVEDASDKERFLSKCKENLCGSYDSNWGCPPGADIDTSDLYESSEYLLLVRRTFCLDVKDRELIDATADEMQRIVRMMVTELRRNGVECLGFSDGGCRYCSSCAYPQPCRFPDMMVPSVSALGLDVGRYLEKSGESYSFSDDCLTLYGFIFVKKRY